LFAVQRPDAVTVLKFGCCTVCECSRQARRSGLWNRCSTWLGLTMECRMIVRTFWSL